MPCTTVTDRTLQVARLSLLDLDRRLNVVLTRNRTVTKLLTVSYAGQYRRKDSGKALVFGHGPLHKHSEVCGGA